MGKTLRLQDMLISAPEFRVETTDGLIHELMGPQHLKSNLQATPLRYLLDENASEMVANTAYNPNNVIAASCDMLRFPATSMWLEWSQTGASKAINALHLSERDLTTAHRRIGALITADDSGRRGTVQIAWSNDENLCDVSPIITEFDLDDPDFCDRGGQKTDACKFQIKGLETLDCLYRHVRCRLDPSWQTYYRTYAPTEASREQHFKKSLEAVAGDYPFIAAFLLMLNARGALRQEPVVFDKLNKKRARRGKTQLLNHITVSLDLEPGEGRSGQHVRGGDGPRLHHVCGHLVRRGKSLFWRRAHLRGNPQKGVISMRTVNVMRGGRSLAA